MYHDTITLIYAIAQVLNFGAIVPVVYRVYTSKTAEAICVPAVAWYTLNGLIITVYMIEYNCGAVIAVITFVQLVLFNIVLGTLAYYKQKKAK